MQISSITILTLIWLCVEKWYSTSSFSVTFDYVFCLWLIGGGRGGEGGLGFSFP